MLLLKYNLQVARLELAVVPLEGESINQLCYTCFLLFNTRGGEPPRSPGLSLAQNLNNHITTINNIPVSELVVSRMANQYGLFRFNNWVDIKLF